MIQPEELVGEEWAAWYRLSPPERWTQSEQLWQIYFRLGGSLEPALSRGTLKLEFGFHA